MMSPGLIAGVSRCTEVMLGSYKPTDPGNYSSVLSFQILQCSKHQAEHPKLSSEQEDVLCLRYTALWLHGQKPVFE